MPDEIDFCRQRFYIVKEQPDDPETVMDRQDRLRLEREHRLLGKILYELEDGQVLPTLRNWRGLFGSTLSEHLAANESRRQAYNDWLELPPQQRNRSPEPPKASLGTEITDRKGHKWVIDGRYLAMLDYLIERLEKWHEYVEETH